MVAHDYCLGENMAVIQRMLASFLRVKLEGSDINASQFIFLMHLFKKDGQSQEQINTHMQYDKGVVARMASSLEKNNYITREINNEDSRAYHLYLTKKARAFNPQMMVILREWNDVLIRGETEKDIKAMSEILKRISDRSIQKVKDIKNG